MVDRVSFKIVIPIEMHDKIYRIAEQSWDEKERKVAYKIAAPGITPSAPVNPIIVKLLEEALKNREKDHKQ